MCVWGGSQTDLVRGAHAGLIRNVIGPPQLLDGLGWHGLGEAQAAPGVGGGPHLGDHRLLQHRCMQGEREEEDGVRFTVQISSLWIHRHTGSCDLLFTWRLNDGSTLGATNDSVLVGALPLVANSFFCS